jgi:hypothetical protein
LRFWKILVLKRKEAPMSDTPRTKAATRMAFTSEYMMEIEEAQKIERELADMTKQRNMLAEALKSLCIAIISEEPRDITDLLKQSGAAIAATKGGDDE